MITELKEGMDLPCQHATLSYEIVAGQTIFVCQSCGEKRYLHLSGLNED